MRLLPIPGVFQPPSDARLLARHLLQERLEPGVSVLDLCTGSGFLALVAATHGASPVSAVDVSRRAILSVRINALLNAVKVRAARGDLFAPVEDRRFDLIVSNPPYLPSFEEALPRRGIARATEAGRAGRAFVDRICADAPRHMSPGGVLLLVHSSVCDEPATLDALARAGLEARVVDRQRGPLGPRLRERADLLRRDRLLLGGDEEELLVFRATLPPTLGPGPARQVEAVATVDGGAAATRRELQLAGRHPGASGAAQPAARV